MALLTILEPTTEARARAGHSDHESPAHHRDLKRERDRRVPARVRVDVRISFARCVDGEDNEPSLLSWTTTSTVR